MRARVIRLWAALLLGMLVCPAAPALGATATTSTATSVFPAPHVADLTPVVPGPVRATGILFAGTLPVAGQRLTLRIRPYGAAAFVDAGTAVTGADGMATVTVPLDRTAQAQWVYAGDPDAGLAGSTSMTYPIQVSPRVGLRVKDRTLRKGQRLVVRGHTFPAKAGCVVKLWRGELRPLVVGPKPVRLDKARVRTDGSYRLVHRFHRKARMHVAVTVAPCAGNDRGLSSYRTVKVR